LNREKLICPYNILILYLQSLFLSQVETIVITACRIQAYQSHHIQQARICHCERSECGNPILTTTEKPSLRGNEVAVAIPLFAIHNSQGIIYIQNYF